MKSILEFQKKKNLGQKITMVTCYDYSFAKLVSQSKVDAILVGDSLAQVMHGHNTTLNASTDLMTLHTRAVSIGAPDKLIVADMPFLSTRKGIENTMNQIEKLMQSGAHAIKIEGAAGHIDLVKHIVESGVPVMGHLGLTPQSIHQLGGAKIQGRQFDAAQKLEDEATQLQAAGCFSLVLECIPHGLAQRVSRSLVIPTIGIGAGPDCDGQILVLQDLLGFNNEFNPKFLKKYLDGHHLVTSALNKYVEETEIQKFPAPENCYD